MPKRIAKRKSGFSSYSKEEAKVALATIQREGIGEIFGISIVTANLLKSPKTGSRSTARRVKIKSRTP